MAFKKDVVLEKKQNILSVVALFLNFAMGDSKFSSRRLAPAKEKKKHENKKTSVVPNDVLPDFGPMIAFN